MVCQKERHVDASLISRLAVVKLIVGRVEKTNVEAMAAEKSARLDQLEAARQEQ